MKELLIKLIVYGHLGFLIEIWFTGLWSLVHRHWKLTSSSYLWMFPFYSVGGLFLDAVRQGLSWPWWLKAFVYVPLIYGLEALSGWTISVITSQLQKWFGGSGGGEIPWQYKRRTTLIRLHVDTI